MSAPPTPTKLAGFSDGEMMLMAAITLHSRAAPDVDWNKVKESIGSASVESCKKRLSTIKQKAARELGNGTAGATSAPAGGIDKKSPSKVKGGAKKATTPRKKKAVKEEVKEDSEKDDTVVKGDGAADKEAGSEEP